MWAGYNLADCLWIQAEDAAAAAEQSLQEAQQRFAEAEAYFEEAKNKIGLYS